MNKEKICIIGGGLGGLFTGALLAKNDCEVIVLEKNQTIGGGLQTFVRDGEVYDTGMHILGGMRENGSVHKICNYLGILDKLQLRDVDTDCMDSIDFLCDGKRYNVASGKEQFIESLAKHFPHERENLQHYVAALFNIAEEVDFFYLRSSNSHLTSHSDTFYIPADQFIATYIQDTHLRSILGYMNPLYCGMKGHTPAYIHCLINVLYINGPSRFVGGSLQMALALKDIIEENGGKVINSMPVTHIEVKNRKIEWIETKDGSLYISDRYISAIHPCAMLALMDDRALPKSYRTRLNEIPNTYSSFKVYLKLKEGTFPYINHTCYCQDNYNYVWDMADSDDSAWPHGFMYMTPPVENQGEFANKLIITAPMSFEMVRKWENTTLMHRGDDYNEWKRDHAERLISMLSKVFPQLPECIEKVYASSPLTIRDYYNVKDGAMCGFRKDCQNLVLSQVPIYTKISNLLLTGQNINLHGICGVPLTAVNTAEAIVGTNTLIEKINNEYTHYEQD